MTFSEYAAEQNITEDSPYTDIIDAAMDHYELRHPRPYRDAMDWWEDAEAYAAHIAERFAR